MTLKKSQESIRNYDFFGRTTCRSCPTGCGLKVFLKDQKIVDIYGDEEHPINKGAICPKGILTSYHLRNPKRIIHPRIRERLEDNFRIVNWNEALAFTSNRLKEISDKMGMEAIYIYGDESAPFDYLAGAGLFAKHYGTPNIPSRFFPAPFGYMGKVKEMFGIPGSQLMMNSPKDWCNSRCILLYGCDLAASDPITFGPIIDARDRGMTLLAIDSKRTITTSKATLGLRVKPGTMSTLIKGILHLIIQKDYIDEQFIKDFTIDFANLKLVVEDYTPEKVSKSCWIGEKDLKKMADLIGRLRPLQIIAGDWFSRRHLSDEDLLLCGALLCVRGSVGIPGGGFNLLNTSPFAWEEWALGKDRDDNLGKDWPSHINLENLVLDSTNNVGAFIWYGNPCSWVAGGKRTKAALRKIPFMVHLSSYPNETFHNSHVSFPMSSWLEYSGLIASNNGRALQWHHKIIEPPGKCKSPFQFWSELASFFELDQYFPWKTKKERKDIVHVCDFFLRNNPITKSASVQKMDPEKNSPGGLLWPCIEDSDLEFENSRYIKGNIRGKNILFQRRDNYPFHDHRFPTSSGKISFSPLLQCKNDRKENPNRLIGGVSLIMIVSVIVDFVEEFGYFLSDRDEHTSTGIIHINPQMGRILQVKNGERIIIENRQGSIMAPVWLNEELDPRVVWLPHGIDPYQPHFNYESPYTLFEPSASKNYTMVKIYNTNQEKRRSEKRIAKFLERFEAMN